VGISGQGIFYEVCSKFSVLDSKTGIFSSDNRLLFDITGILQFFIFNGRNFLEILVFFLNY
jgi:hypothetical protein